MTVPRSKSISHILLFFALLASLLGSAVFVTPAYAIEITVNSSADNTIAGDSFCTLREALANANGNIDTTSGDCLVGDGDDTIAFAPGLVGQTIYLQSVLTLTSNITIDGSGLTPQITISGDTNNDDNNTVNVQVFSVDTGVTVTLNRLTITEGSVSGGNGGGGILNNSGGTLTVTNSTLSGNSGSNGGGIRNDGTLIVTNSTFSGNFTTGGSGGGIRNVGALTVTNSTFSGNTATSGSGSGGGIYNAAGFVSVTITNSTFSGNEADSEGGGIYFDGGTLNYANTIIANSVTGGNPGGDCAGSGSIVINTNNLVEDNTICSASLSGNPGLDSLADNGGPTETFALISGSKAIDAGDDNTCTTSPVSGLDQRGVARPVGTCDIGAYEGSIPDVVVPNVDSFAATSPSSSLNIPITSFTASDNANVSGYLITTSASQPSTGDSGWTGLAPSTYTVGSLGDYTLYPWVKDPSGNISSIYGSPAAVTVCNTSTSVTSNADSGAGTLRQAISDTCAGGTISFYVALSGTTIHLASPLTLSKNLTIDGSALAAQITISGDGAVRVFSVNTSITVTLNSLAITDGSNLSGGGIKNDGTLTITNSTFSGNSAGSGGGGIFSTGTLTITNSTFSGNSAGSGGGGGIHNQGTLTVTNSTLSGNSAGGSGGGIYNNGGTLNFANTLIANSTGGDCVNGGTGTIGTNTNNLIEDTSTNACGLTNDVNGNIIDTDPALGSLADNGGPSQTFALLTGSPAINVGDTTTCAASPVSNLDQRGVARPQGGRCDIGAYEYQTVVTTTDDPGDGTCDATCSLRDAIATASSGDTILFKANLSGGTIHLASSTLDIVKNLTIDGSALAPKITISGEGSVRVFFINSGMTVTLDSLIITGGDGSAASLEGYTGGGGIQNNSGNAGGVVLTVKNSVISGNSADSGGGIFNKDGSTLTVIDSTISNNTATGDGGGILSYGTLTVTGSTISGNSSGATASGDGYEGGGGIREGSDTTITNSTIFGNSANNGYGGGILNNGNLTARNNTLFGNSASASKGGGIYSNNQFHAINNIIANSTSGSDCVGQIDTNTNNLVEDGSCAPIPPINFFTGDPMLDSLADNGGPTQTMALLVGSPAIDVGSNILCESLDQRGVARLGNACDIGAYEGAKDITAPDITINNPNTSAALSKTITASASDGTLTMSNTTGSICDGTLTFIAYSSQTFSLESDNGTKVCYKAADAFGNTAYSLSNAIAGIDTTAAMVNTFTATSPSASLNIPITAFTASDAVGVSGYMITTSSTPPAAGAVGWSVSAPTTYTVASAGSYSLYPWAKDAAGNVSAVFGSPRNVTVTTERILNGGFNTYRSASKIPTNWVKSASFAVTDGKTTTAKKEGTASVKIAGAPGKTKTLTQTLALSGVAGNTFTFSFWARGASIPAAGLCRAQVLLYNGATLKLTKTISCKTGTYAAFQKKTLTFNATSAYTKVVIKFTYSKASGTVWFDAVSLIR